MRSFRGGVRGADVGVVPCRHARALSSQVQQAQAWHEYATFSLRRGREHHGRAEQALRRAVRAAAAEQQPPAGASGAGALHHPASLATLAALLLDQGRATDSLFLGEAAELSRRLAAGAPPGSAWASVGWALLLLVAQAAGDKARASDVAAALAHLQQAEQAGLAAAPQGPGSQDGAGDQEDAAAAAAAELVAGADPAQVSEERRRRYKKACGLAGSARHTDGAPVRVAFAAGERAAGGRRAGGRGGAPRRGARRAGPRPGGAARKLRRAAGRRPPARGRRARVGLAAPGAGACHRPRRAARRRAPRRRRRRSDRRGGGGGGGGGAPHGGAGGRGRSRGPAARARELRGGACGARAAAAPCRLARGRGAVPRRRVAGGRGGAGAGAGVGAGPPAAAAERLRAAG